MRIIIVSPLFSKTKSHIYKFRVDILNIYTLYLNIYALYPQTFRGYLQIPATYLQIHKIHPQKNKKEPAITSPALTKQIYFPAPQQFLYFLPLPQIHGSLRPTSICFTFGFCLTGSPSSFGFTA
jgi:hypothetical protein